MAPDPDLVHDEDPEALQAAAGLVRGVAAAVSVAALGILIGYFLVPFDGPGGVSRTMADMASSHVNQGMAVYAAYVAAFAAVVAFRPRLGPEVLAIAALPLPWLLRGAGVFVSRPGEPLVATLVELAGAVVLVGLLVAVAVTLIRYEPLEEGMPSSVGLALVAGAIALWGTLWLDWFRVSTPSGLGAGPGGGILDLDDTAGRMTWIGFIIAGFALMASVLRPGKARRGAGIALGVLMAFEASRRMMAGTADLVSPLAAGTGLDVLVTVEPIRGLVLVQLGGILAGGFLVHAADLVTPRGHPAEVDLRDPEPEPGPGTRPGAGPGREPGPPADPVDRFRPAPAPPRPGRSDPRPPTSRAPRRPGPGAL